MSQSEQSKDGDVFLHSSVVDGRRMISLLRSIAVLIGQAGRWAGVGVFGVVLLLLVGSLLNGMPTSLFGLSIAVVPLVILLLPQARRACTDDATRATRNTRVQEQ